MTSQASATREAPAQVELRPTCAEAPASTRSLSAKFHVKDEFLEKRLILSVSTIWASKEKGLAV